MDDTVTCLVRGPASKYPRGFVWLIPAWFAILSGAVLLVGAHASITGKLPFWLGLTEIGGLLITACTVFAVLATVRKPAFRADTHGIWLGVRTTRKRPKLRQVHLAWPDIAQLRMVSRRYGVLLEITLSPAARIVHRPGLPKQVLMLLGMLVMPIGFGRGRPALTAPGIDPPRYQIKICDRTAAQLKLALATVKPDELPVRVLTKKGALRFTMPPPRPSPPSKPPQSRKPFSRRPPTPVG